MSGFNGHPDDRGSRKRNNAVLVSDEGIASQKEAGDARHDKDCLRKERNRLSAQRRRDRKLCDLASHQVLQAWAKAQGREVPSTPVLKCEDQPDFSEITDPVKLRQLKNVFSAQKSRDLRSGYLQFCEQFKASLMKAMGEEILGPIWQEICQHVVALDIVVTAPGQNLLTQEQVVFVLERVKSKFPDEGALKESASPVSGRASSGGGSSAGSPSALLLSGAEFWNARAPACPGRVPATPPGSLLPQAAILFGGYDGLGADELLSPGGVVFDDADVLCGILKLLAGPRSPL